MYRRRVVHQPQPVHTLAYDGNAEPIAEETATACHEVRMENVFVFNKSHMTVFALGVSNRHAVNVHVPAPDCGSDMRKE